MIVIWILIALAVGFLAGFIVGRFVCDNQWAKIVNEYRRTHELEMLVEKTKVNKKEKWR